MNQKIILSVLTIFVGLAIFQTTNAAELDTEEQNLINLLNDYRKSLGLSELKATTPLINGAEYFAEYFANHPDDADVNIHKDENYGGPEERGQHYGFYFLTENMGWGYETGQAMFDAWKNSEGHRENMTDASARTIGVSRYYKSGATKDGNLTEWFWILDLSCEGVERLNGNNLTDSELYTKSGYKKIALTIKKRNKQGKYKSARNAEVKVYNTTTGKLIDFDIADKKGRVNLYTYQDVSKVKVKLSKFKGRASATFYEGNRKKKSKKVTWNGNKSYQLKFR